jgi:hypothetical protein
LPLRVTKSEQRRADLQAFGSFHEPTPIGAAAKFAVRRHLKSNLVLQAHDGTDAVVLNARELVVSDLVGGMTAERLSQGLRPQQAADVIGAKRRAAIRTNAHALVCAPLRLSIGQ